LTTKTVTTKRRLKISNCLAKSMVKPSDIAQQLKIPVKTVKNDLGWMRKNSIQWLHKHTLDGYVHATQQTIEQLQDIEEELQKMRKDERNVMKKKSIMMSLVEVINIRWVIQGDGPTYLANKYTNENGHR